MKDNPLISLFWHVDFGNDWGMDLAVSDTTKNEYGYVFHHAAFRKVWAGVTKSDNEDMSGDATFLFLSFHITPSTKKWWT